VTARRPIRSSQANDIVFLPTNSMKALLKSLGTGGVISLVIDTDRGSQPSDDEGAS
jgi:hypothetical protein